MFLGKVKGSVVATQKVVKMVGQKLLIVDPLRLDSQTPPELNPIGRTFIAVDTVGAGEGEVVLLVQGSSARLTPETKDLPVDAVIVAIVDSVNSGGTVVFKNDG